MKDLLLQLSHYPWNDAVKESLLRLLREVVNWEETIELINAHGIIALTANTIKEAGLENEIPESAMRKLETGLMKSVARNTWLRERWKEVDLILSGAGIKHILLKGMALEHTVYGSRGLRQMTDNDIYIEPSEANAAFRLLLLNGFTAEPEKSKLYRKILPYPGKHLPELTKDGYTVEIHTHLPGIFGSSSIIDISNEIKIDERKALVLKDYFHMKYLTEHFIRHAEEGSCQIRMFNDLKMIQPDYPMPFPDEFIYEPDQGWKKRYIKIKYKKAVNSIPAKFRIRYLIGDLFPSINWVQRRYSCGKFLAFFHYPARLLKLLRLL